METKFDYFFFQQLSKSDPSKNFASRGSYSKKTFGCQISDAVLKALESFFQSYCEVKFWRTDGVDNSRFFMQVNPTSRFRDIGEKPVFKIRNFHQKIAKNRWGVVRASERADEEWYRDGTNATRSEISQAPMIAIDIQNPSRNVRAADVLRQIKFFSKICCFNKMRFWMS